MDDELSILSTIKKMLGIAPSYTAFDHELLVHINGAFQHLCQIGVGSPVPFRVTGDSEKWTDFLPEGQLPASKEYIFLRVKLMFDPPSNSFVVNAFNDQLRECEWRLNTFVETPPHEYETNDG